MNSLPVNNIDAADGRPSSQPRRHGLKPSSKKRIEDFRLKKSREAQAQIHKEAFDDTNISLDSLLLALNDLQLGTAKQVAAVPVTTRGIGFSTNECYARAINQAPRAEQMCDVNTIYRVSLAQHQLQMSRSQEHHLLLDPEFRTIEDSDLSIDPSIAQELQGMDQNFSITADIINATGVVEYHQQQFTPFVPAMTVQTESENVSNTPKRRRATVARTVPDPYTVTFNGLKATVAALADAATPVNERQYFVENNPLPGAIFSDDFILTNPDNIIPQDYERIHLKRDLRNAQSFFGLLGSKIASLTGSCTYSGKGSPSQLGSYYKERFRLKGDVMSPSNSRLRFARPLEPSFAVRSAIGLLGEYPVDGLARDRRQFAMREPINQVGYLDIDWSGLITRCLVKR